MAVEDAGPGVRPEDRQRVFDRFWRAPGAPAGGTGLGLAIARWIAEHHDGSIAVDDSAAGGARFEVRLPSPSQLPEVQLVNRPRRSPLALLVVAAVVLAGLAAAGGLRLPVPARRAAAGRRPGHASRPGPAGRPRRSAPLPTGAAGTLGRPASTGTWTIDPSIGSFADFSSSFVGYRVDETFAGQPREHRGRADARRHRLADARPARRITASTSPPT